MIISNIIKDRIVPRVFSRIPFGLLEDVTGIFPLVPYYHMVSDEQVPHAAHIGPFKSVAQFTRDIDGLLKFYEPMDLRDFVSYMKDGRPIPKNSLLLSFDDGYREHFDVAAPILVEKGVPATFFLIVDFLDNLGMAHSNKASLLLDHLGNAGAGKPTDQIWAILAGGGIREATLKSAILSITYRNKNLLDHIAQALDYDFTDYLRKARPYLTSNQAAKLIDMGFTIGAHSLDHPQYSLISHGEQLRQTLESVRILRERFSLEYGAFVFPNSDDNCSVEFFAQLLASGSIDVTFGNMGEMKRAPSRHFPRLPMDNQSGPIESVIGRYYAKGLWDLATDKHVRSARSF